MATYPNVNAANKYARQIVAEQIPACRYVRLACQRHLDDLESSKDKDYPFKFDRKKAERVCRFVQKLIHTKGEWARRRERLVLAGWQLFIFCCVFGWVKKSTNTRRFREVYNEVPRKNGKSAISAGVGHYMFSADGEYGAEIYCGATTEKQAFEVFTPAKIMAQKLPTLRSRFSMSVWAKKLTRTDGSKFEAVIGNPGDGASPSLGIADEFHEHEDSSLYDTLLTGMGSREQPLMWAITTAGFHIDGPCYDMRDRVIQMLEAGGDDELFGIIYTIDEGDDWTLESTLIKANPNYGVSVSGDFLRAQQVRAMKRARYVNAFKTKHLNVWVAGKQAFFNMEKWKACEDKSLTVEDFYGDDCYLGFDLARKLDLVTRMRVFRRKINDQSHYYSVGPAFWVPEDQVDNNDDRKLSELFKGWVESGHLETCDGAEIDYRDILEDAKEVHQESPVLQSAIDPHGAAQLSHSLDDEDLTPVTITQNYTNLSAPMMELEAAILSGRFHHDGNPIITWCMSNVVGKHIPGNDDIVRPIKETPSKKIDGAVALIMAIGRAIDDHEGDWNPLQDFNPDDFTL